MRCPKCGYISFDHIATCLNCSKDLTGELSSLQGTTYSEAAPLFLKFSASSGPRRDFAEVQAVAGDGFGDDEIVDHDLDILVKDDEEDEGIEFNPDASLREEFSGSDDEFEIHLEEEAEEDRALEVDLGGFENAGPDKDDAGEEKFTMDFPDELADISDLAPPAPERAVPAAAAVSSPTTEAGFDSLNLDLKLDGIDEDFSLTSPEKGGDKDIASLSLDDMDFSIEMEEATPAPPKPAPVSAPATKPDEMDMDADLDFELDLGGLSLPEKK